MVGVDRVLLIDDDAELGGMLKEYLRRQGVAVDVALSGDKGLQQFQKEPYGLVLLDVMLPGRDGFEVLRELRQTSRVDVIMLSARGEDIDRILGLEMGADDYLPKPFNPRELLARIRAVQRRTKPASAADGVPEVLSVGDVELDPATRSVQRAGQPVDLTSVEFNLLEVLLREAGRVVTRERLVNAVLSRKFMPFDRSIDMHVSKVRRKLGDSEEDGDHIKTIRGVGYMFARPATKAKK